MRAARRATSWSSTCWSDVLITSWTPSCQLTGVIMDANLQVISSIVSFACYDVLVLHN